METDIKRKIQKRITFDIAEEMHAEIKIVAARKYIPIRTLILRAITKYINEEKKYDMMKE